MNWKRWLGLTIILLFLGIPQACLISVFYILEKTPELVIREFGYIPLNLAHLYLVKIPGMFSSNVVYGLGGLIVAVGLPTVGIWLLVRKEKISDKTTDN